MNFAVIRISGKQYLVKQGDVITIDAVSTQAGKPVEIKDILLLSDGGTVKIGTPLVASKTVEAQVVETGLDQKIRIAKFKAKSRYRKVMGFRAKITKIRITKVGSTKEA